MSETSIQQYLKAQIVETVGKALGVPVESMSVTDGVLVINVPLNGPGSDALFWKAVREAFS